MPSPDVSPFIDLTLYDRDPQDVFDAAVTDLQIKMPEWAPREGNTEVMLMESLALEAAELIFALNRIPNSTVETVLKLYGIDRDAGEPPTTSLLVTLAGSQGYTIPPITVRLDLGNNLDPVVFATDSDVVVPAGQTTVTIAATGDRFTADANGTPAGTFVELLETLFFVEHVELATDVTGGRDPETDDTYFERGVQRFGRLSDTLVLPRHFTTYALEQPYVKRATTMDNYDPANDPEGDGPTGNDPGHVTVAVYGDSQFVAQTDKDTLLAGMSDLSLANLTVHVVDPTITTVDVTVTVVGDPSFIPTDVVNNVKTAVQDYLSPMTWEWGGVVRRNELISVISNVAGVDYIQDFSAPAADVNLTGVANLTQAGTITVTVM